MFESFEGFFYAPALVVQVAETMSREAVRIEQIGHHDADASVAGATADEAHNLGLARALIVSRVETLAGAQRDDLLGQSRMQELAHAGKAGLARSFYPHAKIDLALVQYGHQPATGIASIEQQQVGV